MTEQHRGPVEGIYRKLTVRMYGDERFMRLSPQLPSGQSLWVYLLTGPHTGPIPGVFVVGRAALAEALGWDPEPFAKAFREVLAEGLAEFDEKTRMCFIPNAVRHNMPPNPNVVKSWRTTWLQLPECALRDRIFEHLAAVLTEVSEAFGNAFAEGCGKPLPNPSGKGLAKGMAKQEERTGSRKQEKKKPTASSAAPTLPCPYDSIVDLYHRALPNLPRVRLMPDARQRALRKLWGWILSSSKPDGTRRATTAEEALAWIGSYFERAAANDFLMGRGSRSEAHANWRCDLDFLMTDRGMRHVIEKTEVAA
ncbi:MAG: hypothetical protein M3N82_15705 [Pseudomonadota bacterium]|nr:hypothetical protein [Pseudomonadota bacterium]